MTTTGVYALKKDNGGFKDLGKSHQLPLKKEFQETWFSKERSIHRIVTIIIRM